MIKMPNKNTGAVGIQEWFFKMPSNRAKDLFKRALAEYVIENKLEKKLPQANVSTYKDVVPFMAQLDRKWRFVTDENLNTSLH